MIHPRDVSPPSWRGPMPRLAPKRGSRRGLVSANGLHGGEGMNGMEQDLIESVVATLELQAGTVTAAELDRWRADVATRGWTPEGQVDGCEVMRHATSGCRVDLLIMPAEPDAATEAGADDTPGEGEGRRYAFSSARLSGPDDAPFLADADLTGAQPGGTVAWIIAQREPADPDSEQGAAETAETVTASPFQPPAWRAFIPLAALVLVTLVAASLLAWVARVRMRDRLSGGEDDAR